MISYRKKIIISLILILIAFTTIILLIVWPTVAEISDISSQITQERIKLDRKLAQGANINKVKEDLNYVEQEIDRLNLIFIPIGQELNFISKLEQLAEQNNVDLNIESDFSTIDKQPNKIKTSELKLGLIGNYVSIVNLIRQIEQLNYYYNPDFIILSPQKATDNQSIIVQISGKIFLTEPE